MQGISSLHVAVHVQHNRFLGIETIFGLVVNNRALILDHIFCNFVVRVDRHIVHDFGPTEYPYELVDGEVTQEDFDDRVDIIPVSDPNAGTMAQRIMQYQAALQLAQQAPDMYDLPLLHRQMLEVLGIRDTEDIIPDEDVISPSDPVTENMHIINGEPIKAFIYQIISDHSN